MTSERNMFWTQTLLFDDPPAGDGAQRHRMPLGGRVVDFRFVRRRRRRLGLRVDEHGLTVSAPLRAPRRDVETFVRENARWILARLDQWAARGRPMPLLGCSGETLPLAGAPLTIAVHSGKRNVAVEGGRLVVCVPHPERHDTVRGLLREWLKAHALQVFGPRAAQFAARLGLATPPVAISNARTQWGVCLADGRIRLSWRLAHLAQELSDYVVAHEVAHLVELNHSKRFWRLVETLYPDWRTARRAIGWAAATLPIL